MVVTEGNIVIGRQSINDLIPDNVFNSHFFYKVNIEVTYFSHSFFFFFSFGALSFSISLLCGDIAFCFFIALSHKVIAQLLCISTSLAPHQLYFSFFLFFRHKSTSSDYIVCLHIICMSVCPSELATKLLSVITVYMNICICIELFQPL